MVSSVIDPLPLKSDVDVSRIVVAVLPMVTLALVVSVVVGIELDFNADVVNLIPHVLHMTGHVSLRNCPVGYGSVHLATKKYEHKSRSGLPLHNSPSSVTVEVDVDFDFETVDEGVVLEVEVFNVEEVEEDAVGVELEIVVCDVVVAVLSVVGVSSAVVGVCGVD